MAAIEKPEAKFAGVRSGQSLGSPPRLSAALVTTAWERAVSWASRRGAADFDRIAPPIGGNPPFALCCSVRL